MQLISGIEDGSWMTGALHWWVMFLHGLLGQAQESLAVSRRAQLSAEHCKAWQVWGSLRHGLGRNILGRQDRPSGHWKWPHGTKVPWWNPQACHSYLCWCDVASVSSDGWQCLATSSKTGWRIFWGGHPKDRVAIVIPWPQSIRSCFGWITVRVNARQATPRTSVELCVTVLEIWQAVFNRPSVTSQAYADIAKLWLMPEMATLTIEHFVTREIVLLKLVSPWPVLFKLLSSSLVVSMWSHFQMFVTLAKTC